MSLLPGSTYTGPERISSAQGRHEEIIDAIAKGDGDRAERAAREHIPEGFQFRLTMLAEG